MAKGRKLDTAAEMPRNFAPDYHGGDHKGFMKTSAIVAFEGDHGC